MDPVEITLQVPLASPLKEYEKSQLINSLAQAFKDNGIVHVVVKETYFVDRRSPVVPTEGMISLAVVFALEGLTVQIINALDTIMEDGKVAENKLQIILGSTSLLDDNGNLIADDVVTKLVWAARNTVEAAKKPETTVTTALVYGTVLYPIWSSEPIPVILTITKPHVLNFVVKGRLRGLAPQIKVKWFCCSICGENIEKCEDRIGEKYNERICTAIPREIQFLEQSLTDATVDPHNRVTDVLLIQKAGTEYTWYGFQGVNILDRLRNINNTQKDGVIILEAAKKFRLYFSRRSVGHCKYRKGEAKSKPSATSHHRVVRG